MQQQSEQNWVNNNVTITGPAELLELFSANKLKFQKFHPRPEEEFHDWNIVHWGCRTDPIISDLYLGGGSLSCQFKTAWMPPTAFLTYLTEFYDGLTIENKYHDEFYEFIGYSKSEDGVTCNEFIEPCLYSLPVLKDFAAKNSWVDLTEYEMFVDSLTPYYSDGMVLSNISRESYNEIVERMSEVVGGMTMVG